MGFVDWAVIRSSAIAGLLVIVPAAAIAQWLVSADAGAWAFVFLLIVLLGFTVSGFGAGFLRSDTPMKHGAIAAIVCYGLVQGVAAIVRLARGDGINPLTYPLLALLAGSFGLVGGLFGDWHRRRTRRG